MLWRPKLDTHFKGDWHKTVENSMPYVQSIKKHSLLFKSPILYLVSVLWGGGFPNYGLVISEIKKALICLSEGQHLERLSLFRFLFHKQTVCFIICRLLTRSCWLSTSLKYFCLLLCKNWGMISSALASLVRTSGRQRETIGPYIRVASIWQ